MKRLGLICVLALMASGCASYEGTDYEGQSPRERFLETVAPEGMRRVCTSEPVLGTNRREQVCTNVPEDDADETN
ncbi:hypothetical protein AWH62_13595 [Maricaulis sp. W15]|uniref:Lipoprotein n=1 Tax=Maricaulis maris TaxID=74318 RepID=A0A495D317_9PROT|nr:MULTISPECIES: hypothetical protein [Maricaulis]OLF71085.1 hypothetical protein AWH62_13595 [Maricaulis sp. W15]RKQ96146.1 hypothetical protein C7435_2398 [Maricaulis maris]